MLRSPNSPDPSGVHDYKSLGTQRSSAACPVCRPRKARSVIARSRSTLPLPSCSFVVLSPPTWRCWKTNESNDELNDLWCPPTATLVTRTNAAFHHAESCDDRPRDLPLNPPLQECTVISFGARTAMLIIGIGVPHYNYHSAMTAFEFPPGLRHCYPFLRIARYGSVDRPFSTGGINDSTENAMRIVVSAQSCYSRRSGRAAVSGWFDSGAVQRAGRPRLWGSWSRQKGRSRWRERPRSRKRPGLRGSSSSHGKRRASGRLLRGRG